MLPSAVPDWIANALPPLPEPVRQWIDNPRKALAAAVVLAVIGIGLGGSAIYFEQVVKPERAQLVASYPSQQQSEADFQKSMERARELGRAEYRASHPDAPKSP